MVAKRLTHLLGKVDLSNIKHILDIGSRDIGQSIEFSKIFSDGIIDAFEPVPDSFQQCVDNRARLDEITKKRIRLHNVALASTIGELPFYPVDPVLSSVPNTGASSMFKFIDGLNGSAFGQTLVQQEITVSSTTLDSWCNENGVSQVDIMWVDAQGAELLIFQGGEAILKNTKVVMTEVGLQPYYEGHTLKVDIDAFLSRLGFIELPGSLEINVPDYEANTIYIRHA